MKHIVLYFVLITLGHKSYSQDLRKEIANCAAIENSIERLSAYDALAARLGVDKDRSSNEIVAGKWTLRTDISPMDDKKSYYLSLDAENPVGTGIVSGTPRMIIRYKEGSFDCYINMGIFLGSDEIEVTTRLDKYKPTTKLWGISTDNKAIFAPGDAKQFVNALMKSQSLVIRLTPYSESPVTTMFNLEGLSKAMGPIIAAMK